MGTMRQKKVLYCSDSYLARSPSRIGKNSMIEITNVMIERARLMAIRACDMLVSRILRGNTIGRFVLLLRTLLAHELQEEAVTFVVDG